MKPDSRYCPDYSPQDKTQRYSPESKKWFRNLKRFKTYIYEMEGAVLIQFKKQFFVSEESPENIILRVNSMEGVT